jgi:non-canonical purine NTP pyrophosphatase (RdgB/HAM1 family)
MNEVTFITGNLNKAAVFAKYMDFPIAHRKVELDEVQSLDLREITTHKIRQAYKLVKSPVLVEDTGCSLDAFGRFPGPFIKWMMKEISLEEICRLVDGRDRGAKASICYGYYNGNDLKFFEGSIHGVVPDHPRGSDGFGFNAIFIPDGDSLTYAESGKNFREVAVFPELKKFLQNIDKS